MEATIILGIVLGIFVIFFMFYFVKYVASEDLKWFCREQIDRFPIESVCLLSKKEVESFRFAFSARVFRGNDKQAIHDAIVRLKGYRGKILQQAYDFALNQ